MAKCMECSSDGVKLWCAADHADHLRCWGCWVQRALYKIPTGIVPDVDAATGEIIPMVIAEGSDNSVMVQYMRDHVPAHAEQGGEDAWRALPLTGLGPA